MLLPLESAILHKKERYFFTLPGPKSEMFSIIRFLPKHEANGQNLGILQNQKECSDGPTDIFNGYSIGW